MDFLHYSISAGEKLAQASLSAEHLVLRLAKVEQRRKYLGRSQYPKFVSRPVVGARTTENKYVCEHVQYWSQMYNTFSELSLHQADSQRQKHIGRLCDLMTQLHSHTHENMPPFSYTQGEATVESDSPHGPSQSQVEPTSQPSSTTQVTTRVSQAEGSDSPPGQ